MDGKFALDSILTRAFHENNVDLAKLQVEENGRNVASLQGHYYGMTIYEAFFKSIDDEMERREKAKREKEEELPFDGDGPAGEPGILKPKPLAIKAPDKAAADTEDEAAEATT